MKDKLIVEAGFSTTFERDRLERLIELTLLKAFEIMAYPPNTNTCVYTTFDSGVAGCVVERSIDAICKEFNINRPIGIKYEAVVGREISAK